MLRRKRPPVDPMTVDAEGNWAILEGTHEGERLLARCNVALKAAVGHPDYPIQVGVAVPFREPRPGGFPSPEENEELVAIEGTIDSLVAGKAVLAAVVTTGGMREFVLYTGSGDWIEGFHRGLEAAVATHEVQVMAQTDPDWAVYRQFSG